ncbi:hypothetical protein ACWC98_10815 [Streptomyces goshikiensis]|uniref:hypothetical protein n=1 Tax=Streptomyces goshikiensis TaxID=1942 RepID=UPI00332494F9
MDDFNDWLPGVHTLKARKGSKRAATVVATPSEIVHSFRYPTAGDTAATTTAPVAEPALKAACTREWLRSSAT